MERKSKILKFRAVNRDIFNAIVSGKKKIETRAATEKYRDIKVGDIVLLVCGNKKVKKQVKKVERFTSIAAILRKYNPETINPKTRTAQEARTVWYGFPGYKGLVAMHLE